MLLRGQREGIVTAMVATALLAGCSFAPDSSTPDHGGEPAVTTEPTFEGGEDQVNLAEYPARIEVYAQLIEIADASQPAFMLRTGPGVVSVVFHTQPMIMGTYVIAAPEGFSLPADPEQQSDALFQLADLTGGALHVVEVRW